MGASAWIGLGLLAALLAAGVTLFARVGLQSVDSVLATTLRSAVMTAALVLLAATRGGVGELLAGRAQLDSRAWLCILGAGLCGAGSWLAYFAALEVGRAGPVAALDRLSLPLVFVLGFALLGERVGLRGWLGLGLVMAKRIVEGHGGTIAHQRGSDGGAVFKVVLNASADSIC